MDTGLRELQVSMMDMEAWRAAVDGIADSDMTEWLDWTELNWYFAYIIVTCRIHSLFKYFK